MNFQKLELFSGSPDSLSVIVFKLKMLWLSLIFLGFKVAIYQFDGYICTVELVEFR